MQKKSSNKIHRIGIVLGKWYGGGVEAVIMNYYNNIDRNKIQFDFICDSDSTNIPYKEIESLGGKVILCPPYQKLFNYIKELIKIFRDNKYEIVHSNINALSVFPLYAAKKAKVPIRIAHNHSTANKKEWKKTLLKNLLKPFSKMYATHYFACTEHAGRWLFGNKAIKSGNVFIVNNGIDLNKYKFDDKIRRRKRKELNLQETDIVIGHIGRFVKQKNHDYLIDVFNELHKDNKNYKLMLLGQGPLQKTIKNKVQQIGIEQDVLFLGQRTDGYDYYQAMDLFLFPSLYEGLGMVVIEAQTSGLPCVVSGEVPQIAKVSDNISFLELKEPIENWIKAVKKYERKTRNANLDLITKKGYNIKKEAKKLEEKYIELIKSVSK